MKILMTGATGFLGGRVLRALLERGDRVAAVVRDPERWRDAPSDAEISRGDVTRPETLAAASTADFDVVVHAAALVKMWVKDRGAFDRVNVDGFRHVLETARSCGARLVHISSFIALGPSNGHDLGPEAPRPRSAYFTDYERTKTEADRLARAVAPSDVEVVRLYPGVVFGPGALTDGNHVVRLLLQHARGELPGMLGRGDRRQCFAYVDDVVSGVLAAVDRGEPGTGYLLGGENRTVRELFEAFERSSGVAPPKRSIPFAVASAIGKLQRWRAEWLGVEPELTDEVVEVYRREWAYSSASAVEGLGYRITPFEDAVRETVTWLVREGELEAAGG